MRMANQLDIESDCLTLGWSVLMSSLSPRFGAEGVGRNLSPLVSTAKYL